MRNVIIVVYFISMLMFATLGIENQLLSLNRPMFTLCVDLGTAFFMIGYLGIEQELRQRHIEIEKKIKFLKRYIKEN